MSAGIIDFATGKIIAKAKRKSKFSWREKVDACLVMKDLLSPAEIGFLISMSLVLDSDHPSDDEATSISAIVSRLRKWAKGGDA